MIKLNDMSLFVKLVIIQPKDYFRKGIIVGGLLLDDILCNNLQY